MRWLRALDSPANQPKDVKPESVVSERGESVSRRRSRMSIREKPNVKPHDEAIFNQTRPEVTLLAILTVFMVFLFPKVGALSDSGGFGQ